MQKIKEGDSVIVIAGKDKGKTGKVKTVNLKTSSVIVEGINTVKKAVKQSQDGTQGGIITKDSPLHISNVALMSPVTNKPTKVKVKVEQNKNIRIAKKCGTALDK